MRSRLAAVPALTLLLAAPGAGGAAEERRAPVLNSEPCRAAEGVAGRELAATMTHAFLDFKGGAYQKESGIDYRAVRDSEEWRTYSGLAGCLRSFDPSVLETREERLAFWINTYNALVVHGVIAAGIPESVLDLPAFFENTAYEIGGLRYSLDPIEHGILRGNVPKAAGAPSILAQEDPRLRHALGDLDPRIHFALVCGGRSCPPVRVFQAQGIDARLDEAARAFLNAAVKVAPDGKGLRLPTILRWFEDDFGGREGVIELLRKHLEPGPARKMVEGGTAPRISFVEFDWRLNHAS